MMRMNGMKFTWWVGGAKVRWSEKGGKVSSPLE